MHEEELPPGPLLMESMRSVGYTLQSAVADVVDNSISAGASTVRIAFSATESFIAIVDDGEGMSGDQLRQAMRLAGNGASYVRRTGDLGRFGLGLKTASLSQCRELTVISKRDGSTNGVRWSLDRIAESGRWSLIVLGDNEMDELPGRELLDTHRSGTLVLWRQLDRLVEPGETPRAFDARMVLVRDHLALVFHRFIAGEHGRAFSIHINGVEARRIDPFLISHPSTQIGPREALVVDGCRIEVRPFTLPLLSKMTTADRERAHVAGRLRESQGFYIYRALRLVIWGTWFGIARQDDLGKLARVRVDIPNSLDHLWSLDIKKSAAIPPGPIRRELRRIVDRIVAPSRDVHLYRGRVEEANDSVRRTWRLVHDRGGAFRYEVNRNHPVVAALASKLAQQDAEALEGVIAMLENSFPLDDAFNRLGQDESHDPAPEDTAALEQLARGVWAISRAEGQGPDDFVNLMAASEPFSRSPNSRNLLRRIVQDK